jgi:hypothetical protein
VARVYESRKLASPVSNAAGICWWPSATIVDLNFAIETTTQIETFLILMGLIGGRAHVILAVQ